MTDENHTGERQNTPRGEHSRKDRLRLKLRENLRRRKSQLMERSRMVDTRTGGHQVSPDGEVGKGDE